MHVELENGIRVLRPDNPNNILRSRKTNYIFEYVFLSVGDSEDFYVEEELIDTSLSNIQILELLKKHKLDDLDAKYRITKDMIQHAKSKEELDNIIIFK